MSKEKTVNKIDNKAEEKSKEKLDPVKAFRPIFKLIADRTIDYSENKRNLCSIVINDKLSDKEKLSSVQRKILEFKSKETEYEEKSEEKKLDAELDLDSDLDMIMNITKLMNELMSPIKGYNELLEKIGTVLRDEQITDQVKVDKITNLLI